MPKRDVVVIGASAGGLGALSTLCRDLPGDLPAAVFIVMHVSPHYYSLLPELLSRHGNMPVHHGADGEPIRQSRIYVAPPDHHMVLEEGRVRITRGPKENRSRPAVDTLFRSAAYACGPRAIGVVLTGTLDDGTAGLWSIKDRGGIAVVQDPEEAEHPSMPLSARQHVNVDYCLPLAQIGRTLVRLTEEKADRSEDHPMPQNLEIETRIALENNPLAAGVMKLGEPSRFACPTCHGALVEMKNGELVRFRCHTGHAFSMENLLAALSEATEDTLWSSVRAMDEKIMLLEHLARHAREAEQAETMEMLTRAIAEAKRQLDLLREAVLSENTVKAEALSED